MVLDTWSETALLGITKLDGSANQFATIIETVSGSGGVKDFESIASLAGGRLKRFSPQEDIEISIEGYAVEVGTDAAGTANGFMDLLHGGLNSDTTQPLKISSDKDRSEYQMVILWTDDTSITAAESAVNLNQNGKRFVFKNGHFTNVEWEMAGDKVLKYTLTYKVTPFDKSGSSNIDYESTDGTATMTAVASYTS